MMVNNLTSMTDLEIISKFEQIDARLDNHLTCINAITEAVNEQAKTVNKNADIVTSTMLRSMKLHIWTNLATIAVGIGLLIHIIVS